MTTEEEHYSLRWNNHQNHILRAFDSLLQTKTLVDVTLVCAETSIRAHKVVLSACSPFFQRVFSETPCKHPVIVLKDFRGWVVQAIVDFMYRGEISVPQQRLQALIQAGESLQVRGLVDHPVTGKTPTPAASPDDFAMMDTSIVSPESPPQSSFEDHPAMMGAKLMLPTHHMYMNSSAASVAGAELCTSPMPRRKQARPRRRSGECGPHDLTSKSPTPKRSTSPSDCARTTADGDEVIHHDDEMMMHEADDKENKPEPNLIDDEDADEDDEECKEIKSVTARKDNEDEDDVGGGGDGVGDVDEDDDDGHDEEDIEERDEEGEEGASGEGPEDLCTKNSLSNNNNSDSLRNNNNNNNNNTTSSSNNNNNNSSSNNNNNNRIVLSLKDIRHLNRPPTMGRNVPIPPPHLAGPNGSAISPLDFHHHHQQQQQQQHQQHMQQQHQHHQNSSKDHHALMQSAAEHMKREAMENHARMETISPNFLEQMDLSMPHHMHHPHHPHHPHMPSLHDLENRGMHKDFPSSPMSLPSHFNPPDGPPHPPSPLPFPGMSSALTLTPPHMFGLDSPLGLFPPGMDPGKLYNPLMDMSDPRGMHSEHHSPYMKKKMSRPKGQHSAPRGGPPRSWTNAELTEALQHVWNKKMTTSQASRIFGIPYNSLLMYVRGKYGKSLKLEQLRKDCISGPPIELLTMGLAASKAHLSESRKNSSNNDMKDMDGGPQMQRSSSSEPDLMSSPNPMFNPFPHGFYPDFPGGFPGLPLSMLSLMPPERHPPPMHLNSSLDEDCKSDRSKQSLEDEFTQPLALNREERRELMQQNGGGGGGGQD